MRILSPKRFGKRNSYPLFTHILYCKVKLILLHSLLSEVCNNCIYHFVHFFDGDFCRFSTTQKCTPVNNYPRKQSFFAHNKRRMPAIGSFGCCICHILRVCPYFFFYLFCCLNNYTNRRTSFIRLSQELQFLCKNCKSIIM